MKHFAKASAGTFLILCACPKPATSQARKSLRLCDWISRKASGLRTVLLLQEFYSWECFRKYVFVTHTITTHTHTSISLLKLHQQNCVKTFKRKLLTLAVLEGEAHTSNKATYMRDRVLTHQGTSVKNGSWFPRDRSGCWAVSLSTEILFSEIPSWGVKHRYDIVWHLKLAKNEIPLKYLNGFKIGT